MHARHVCSPYKLQQRVPGITCTLHSNSVCDGFYVPQFVIEGRRDIKGGRLEGDRRAAGNLASGAAFRSLAYSADGTFLVAGGSSKYVVIYDVAERVMLRRFSLTSNRSLDGVLDMLNSKNVTDAGPLQLIDHEPDEDDAALLPVSAQQIQRDQKTKCD